MLPYVGDTACNFRHVDCSVGCGETDRDAPEVEMKDDDGFHGVEMAGVRQEAGGQGKATQSSQFQRWFGSGEANCWRRLFVARIRAADLMQGDAMRSHASTSKVAYHGRDWASVELRPPTRHRTVGGGGDQARTQAQLKQPEPASASFEPPFTCFGQGLRNRVLGQGGPCPGSFFFFMAQRQAPPKR